MNQSNTPLEPVRVELVDTNVITRFPCNLCGGHTAKVSVVAAVEEGPLAGFLACENCLRRLSEGESVDTLLRDRADRLLADAQAEAALLRSVVGRLHVPCYREWGRKSLERDYRALLDDCSHAFDEPFEGLGPRVSVDTLRIRLLGGLTGDSGGGWLDGPAFQLFALACAIEDGYLTLHELKDAAVQAAFPMRDNPQTAGSDADGAPL